MTTTVLDPYATLGIPPSATRAEAGRAHRRLAKRYHPDVNPGREAAEEMRRVNDAWRILSDPARRSRYDADRAAATGTTTWHGPAAAYGPRAGTATWTTWPDDRVSSVPRMRRPARPEPPAPTFGDRPVVLLAVWAFLGLLYIVGAWLGSLTP
jgi:curved DNA-binding protein CbpA